MKLFSEALLSRFVPQPGLVFGTVLLVASPSVAGSLSDVFDKDLAGLELEPLGKVFADTVASTYPVASASSSVTYVYNPRLDALERRTRVLGPIIGERAETIGAKQFDVGLTYSYVRPNRINEQDLDDLENEPLLDGRVVSFPVPGGVELADGRATNFLPVHVQASIDLEAQIVTPGFSYGLTPNWDVNVTLPLMRTFLRVEIRDEVPDPRLAQFALPPGSPLAAERKRTFSDDSVGVGDLLLRTKYVFLRERPLDFAAFLGVSVPTGNEDDFQGTGTTRVQPSLVLSRVFDERVELLANLGADINANDVERSVLRWAAGFTGQVFAPLTLAVVFLGRHELDEQTDPIDAPFFFQVERNDLVDVSVGLRWLFTENWVASANALMPLTDQGLRAAVIPTVQLEYGFRAPW